MPTWPEHTDESLIDYAATHLEYAIPASMEMQRRVMVALQKFDAESAAHATAMAALTRRTVTLTVVMGVLAALQLAIGGLQLWTSIRTALAAPAAISAAAVAEDVRVVNVPGRELRLPAARWTPMQNEVEWADNFEETPKDARHAFPRIVTVFKLPLSDDRHAEAVKISPTESLELFVSHPGMVTALVIVDRGTYWVLSRETFELAGPPRPVGMTLTGSLFGIVRAMLQPQLDATRHLLQTQF